MSCLDRLPVPVLSLTMVLAACTTTPPTAASAPEPNCNAEGAWNDAVTELGESVWTIAGDGSAAETGMHSATGRATVVGHVLRITASTASGFTGEYEVTLDVDCRAGEGRLTWTRAPEGVQLRSFPVTFVRR